MTTFTPTYMPTKFEELVLHIAARSVADPQFGKTKLNKVLFYVDFLAFGILDTPVTGAEYQRRPFGPVPRQIVEGRDNLLHRGDARIEYTERFGYVQERLVPNRPADTSVLTAAELKLVNDVIDALSMHNASSVSELSHREPGWQLAADGESIPYAAVYLGQPVLTEYDVRRGQEVYKLLNSAS
jgi:hypothetical protein